MTSAGKGCRLGRGGPGSETAQLSGPAFHQQPACQPLGTFPMITSKHFEIHRCNFLRLKERLYLLAFEVDKELCVVTMIVAFTDQPFKRQRGNYECKSSCHFHSSQPFGQIRGPA